MIPVPALHRACIVGVLAATLAMQAGPATCSDTKYRATDALFEAVAANVAAAGALEIVVEIDHARLAESVGEEMPAARVLLFSDAALEADLLTLNPRIGLDLPLRVLAYSDPGSDQARILTNPASYLETRHKVRFADETRERYRDALGNALRGLPSDVLVSAPGDAMSEDGIVVLESPLDLETTLEKMRAAIDAQDDTVWFGEIDFSERAARLGIDLPQMRLLLFGGPAPGGRAMAAGPTLGLDAFCQKLLVIEREAGQVDVLFNDLLVQADRLNVRKTAALRIINRRLRKTFSGALEGGFHDRG